MTTDREATQDHAILNCLVEYTGQFLSGDLVEQIWKELVLEMRQGKCSWAFAGTEDSEDVKAGETCDEAKPIPTIRPRYTDIVEDKQ